MRVASCAHIWPMQACIADNVHTFRQCRTAHAHRHLFDLHCACKQHTVMHQHTDPMSGDTLASGFRRCTRLRRNATSSFGATSILLSRMTLANSIWSTSRSTRLRSSSSAMSTFLASGCSCCDATGARDEHTKRERYTQALHWQGDQNAATRGCCDATGIGGV